MEYVAELEVTGAATGTEDDREKSTKISSSSGVFIWE